VELDLDLDSIQTVEEFSSDADGCKGVGYPGLSIFTSPGYPTPLQPSDVEVSESGEKLSDTDEVVENDEDVDISMASSVPESLRERGGRRH
jgi:hypothetical protein